jgi:hypothetical protein
MMGCAMSLIQNPHILRRLFSNTSTTFVWALLFLIFATLVRNSYVLQLFNTPPPGSTEPSELVLIVSELFKELPFAPIIGVMVAEGIERVSKAKQIEEVN